MSTNSEPDGFEALLEYVRQTRGVDFGGYKPSTLRRRVAKRVNAVGATSYPEYLDHLQVDADEFSRLFDTILINVTSFFRDGAAWEFLRSEVVPAILAQ
ncbi:MAG: chemotaxis protein CheR, partial [Candidatus Dormibacteraeota bacterium]|nr:chemotaxis protein CheR [Candidatus Dormibacteraeota bacterium]